jgi:hypothetical protein
MHNPRGSRWAKWFIWSAVAAAGAALFYVLVIDPTIVAIAPFAIGCLLAQRCAP